LYVPADTSLPLGTGSAIEASGFVIRKPVPGGQTDSHEALPAGVIAQARVCAAHASEHVVEGIHMIDDA
jgi:hypothetical protein